MDPEKLKVVELRTELAQRGLDTKGVKSVLVERLRKAIEEEFANQNNQGKANADTENADDDMVQENDEKATKSTRVPQTPKKSSRLSKTAPMTPREDPAAKKRRTSRMSYSRRRTSPKKSDQNDISRESSPAPSESALQDEGIMSEDAIQEADAQEELNAQEEADVPEKIDVEEKTDVQIESVKELSTEKETPAQHEPVIEKDASVHEDPVLEKEIAKQDVKPVEPEENKEEDQKSSEDVEKESSISVKVSETEKEENIEITRSNEDKNDTNLSSTSSVETVAKHSNDTDTTTEKLKSDEDVANQNDEQTDVGLEEETAKSIDIKEETAKSIDIKEETAKSIVVKEETAKSIDIKEETAKSIDIKEETAKSIDMKEDEAIALNADENDTVNEDNDVYGKTLDSKIQSVQHDEENVNCMDSNNVAESANENKPTDILTTEEQAKDPFEGEKNIDINKNDKLKTEDEFMEVESSGKEEDHGTDEKHNEEDVEMPEIKPEEDSNAHVEERDTNIVVMNKKRKRSPSPLDYRHESPSPVFIENEPEIDDSALILSWYDSDLNLVIDKDGFFTATPMHNDGFSHMWAGARASYGFLCGKVYYEAKIVEYCTINAEKDEQPHVLRIGWSTAYTSMQLGEEKFSFGYSSTGKKLTNNQYEDYGHEFGKDDVIGCYCDATSDNVILSYTINGKEQGPAFSITKEELGDKPLFPHILSKNCSFACNFGQETPWNTEILQDYVSIGNVESQYKIPGLRRPEKKEECEVIMMCGLPACGKTTWATKYATEHPEKMYNILGLSSLIDKMKDPGQSYKQEYDGQWKELIDKCTDALDRLMEIASSRRRNYILDQTNAYLSAQRRKMKSFSGYQRKAVVIVPPEEEFKSRAAKHKTIEGKDLTDSMLLEMKASFRAPIVGDCFDVVDWVELNEEEGAKIIEKYNKEAKEAGYGEQQISKRARTDSRSGLSHESRSDGRSSRDNRDNRDYRDRRNNYADRNRNPIWRGGIGNMRWRDRPQRGGGNTRHGGGSGYGPPLPRRRRGAPIPLVHRGMNRRGGNVERRGGNDRGRSLASRQGPRSRAPIGNYQGGGQQSVWNQQGSWSNQNQSQDGWGQQNNWASSQPWGNWKSYGQGSYNQNNYQQSGYGNGNWNSWNQQYYNQYWGQQQQSGQTTTTSGQTANKQ